MSSAIILGICPEIIKMSPVIREPQMKAPRVAPLEGVSTYALRGIGVRGVENPQGFGIDERRYIPVTDFAAQSNGSIHRKGREKRKAQKHKSLNSEEIIRTGTRISRIGRIFTDPGVSVSTVTPVDCMHTYASALAYVDVYSAQSVFYRTPPIIDNDKKPQINAD